MHPISPKGKMRVEVQVPASSHSGITVAYFYNDKDESEVASFMASLPQEARKKTLSLFRIASTHWPITNPEKCHQVEGDIHEFKSHQVRILWFLDPANHGVVVCASSELKKRGDLKPGTIKRAQDRLTEWTAFLRQSQPQKGR